MSIYTVAEICHRVFVKNCVMTFNSDTFILKVALAFAAMILSVNAFAQNSFTVSLRLADENTEAPVGFATASITKK